MSNETKTIPTRLENKKDKKHTFNLLLAAFIYFLSLSILFNILLIKTIFYTINDIKQALLLISNMLSSGFAVIFYYLYKRNQEA